METIYNVEGTALDGLINLLKEDFDVVEEEEFDSIEFLQRLAETISKDYMEAGHDAVSLHLVGKHVEEFGKHLKSSCKKEAIAVYRQLVDETGEKGHKYNGNDLSLMIRENKDVIENKRLKRLRQKLEGQKKAVKQEEKRLKKAGEVTDGNPTYSITVSKS